MEPMEGFTLLFILIVAGGMALELWLATRQSAAARAHRDQVPEAFVGQVSPEAHRKAADYTAAKVRLARIGTVLDALLTLALTVGGGITALDALWMRTGESELWRGTAVIASVSALVMLVNLPLSLWRTFVLEARFGFNRTTVRLYLLDAVKGIMLAVVLGVPVVLAALWLMVRAGSLWWLWAFGGWVVLTLLLSWAWPVVIAPLFNRFSPLADAALKARIEALLGRCGFTSSGVFVVDGSRRSAHGNAYFTGFGRHKRIVFFDTLLEQLAPVEIEAVLAHELGHFRLHHVRAGLAASIAVMFAALALLGWLARQAAFYHALGVAQPSAHAALLLFAFAAPAVLYFATPLSALWSRRHEYAADRFAGAHADAHALATALVKLYGNNASTLTPDPLYSGFHDSHPPPLARIARLSGV
jgi:STE24 endopeptidase